MDFLEQLPEVDGFDVVVIGAGGAGMAAALSASLAIEAQGGQVLLLEKSAFVGGTTAWSAGTVWIPGSRHAHAVNPSDSVEQVRTYLNQAVGARASASLREAFFKLGPEAVEFFETRTELKFRPYAKHPDYMSELPGSTLNGRALEPLPFDGRRLAKWFKRLRLPIPEFTVLQGMMVDRNDINHLLALRHSWGSFKHSLNILARHLLDRLRYPRGTRLVMGNALSARLLYSLTLRPNVSLILNASAIDLQRGPQGVDAITLECNGTHRQYGVRRAVMAASGGFNRNPQMRARIMPGIQDEWRPTPPDPKLNPQGDRGNVQDLLSRVGAQFAIPTTGQPKGSPDLPLSAAFWAPVSLRKRPDGSQAVFPHFVMDRAKPGMLTVNRQGLRFVNESTSYHLFALAMQAQASPCFLICDSLALQKYGLGMIRPGGAGASEQRLKPFVADGYLTQGTSLAQLAERLGIPPQALIGSVETMNRYARTGNDLDHQRGVTAYQQNLGDALAGGVNPNLGTIAAAPYYAIKLFPGDIGASAGFITNQDAQCLDEQGEAIAGLYAVGNDMNSIMGGVYPAPGITLGPALTFAYAAGQHCAQGRRP
jgi:FAD binding domain